MAYTTVDGYKFEAQVNYGWGLTLNMTGKAPEVSKRIFDTYEHMLYYVNDYNDSCVPGLCLKVMADGDKNGVYFVSAIGTEGADKAFANDGAVLKLGTDVRIIAAEADIKAIEDALGELPEGKTIAQMFIDEKTARENGIKEAIEALDVAEMAEAGKFVSSVSQTDGKVAVEFKAVEAAEVLVNKTDGEGGNAFTAETVQGVLEEIQKEYMAADDFLAGAMDDAIAAEAKARDDADKAITGQMAADKAELEKAIEDAQAAAEATATKMEKAADAAHLTLTSAVSESTGAITYTIGESDIASAQGLANEIARAESAETELNNAITALTKTVSDNKTDIEGQLASAETRLNEAIEAEKDRAESAETALNNAITTETSAREAADTTLTNKIGDIAADKTVAETIADVKAELEGKIDQTSEDKSYSIVSVTGEELSGLGANVKEAYKLVDGTSAHTQAGEYIKIYKDSALKSVALSGQNLVFTYVLADGSDSVVSVDVSAFLHESEYGDGLQVVDHVVSIKKDASSEAFLTVGEGGIKISGVQTAIDDAVAAEASARTEAIEAEKDRAESAETRLNEAITAETANREAADKEINDKIGEVPTGKTVVGMIEDAQAAAEAAATKMEKAADAAHLTLSHVTDDETGAITYTIGESDIASASVTNAAITAETAAREAAISAETTARTAADEALQTAIDNEATARTAADNALSDRIAAFESGDNSVAKQIENAVNAEKERAESAETTLNNAITAETSAREAAISAETAAREAAISAETAAREAAISAETTARTAADNALSDRLDALEGVKITGKDAIVVSAEGATADKEVSLKLGAQPAENAAGVVLSQDTNGLVAKLQWGSF